MDIVGEPRKSYTRKRERKNNIARTHTKTHLWYNLLTCRSRSVLTISLWTAQKTKISFIIALIIFIFVKLFWKASLEVIIIHFAPHFLSFLVKVWWKEVANLKLKGNISVPTPNSPELWMMRMLIFIFLECPSTFFSLKITQNYSSELSASGMKGGVKIRLISILQEIVMILLKRVVVILERMPLTITLLD